MYALATITAATIMPPAFPLLVHSLTIRPLGLGQEREVLAFLAQRPIHTVIMAGFVRDNGLVSPLNRGTFYGCRDAAGHLRGVALIGHVTIVETESDEALELFALLAQKYDRAFVVVGEQEKVERFWEFYGPAGQSMRRLCRELLMEQHSPVAVHEPVAMRRATLADIELIMPIHAEMAFEESGVNPMVKDPIGFRQRMAHRIEQGRIWVWTEADRLIFKADVISDTPEAIYLEGIYVAPEERGQGAGVRFISQLTRTLLTGTKSVCMLVNETNEAAQACYQKAGYKVRGYYDTVFLQ
jgi:predicted GNAT family acetyltransferase